MTTRTSPAESSVLCTQTSTTPAYTVSVILLEASEQFSHDRLGQWVATSLPRIARFRSRLVGKPLGAGQPVWAEIDDYDPNSQIHRATAPAPGGELQLADLVTNLTSGQQHWRTWLWEAWTVDGLAGDRWALVLKMSSVLSAESSASTAVRDCLLTSARKSESDGPTEMGPGPQPSLAELVVDTLSEMVENQITGMWMVAEAVTGALLAARRRLQDAQEPTVVGARTASSMSGPVPLTVLAAPLTERRSMAFVSLRVADVKVISDAFGGNTANVVLAACTLSLRAWLQRHDAVPADALVMEVPLALPAGDPAGAGGTVATGRVRLPVQLDDPVQVLSNLHTATERLNIANSADDEEVTAGIDFASAVSLLPPWAARAGMQVYRSLGKPGSHVPTCHGSVSFVAESLGPLFCAGAEVVGLYTAEPMVERRGVSVTVTSHADVMDLCVSACPDNVPHVDELAGGIPDAVGVLFSAAARSPRGEGRSVVTEMGSHSSRHAHG